MYDNAVIYKIVNSTDGQIYVGSTTTTLSKRLHQHKRASRKNHERPLYAHLHNVGFNNFRIVLVEEFP